MSKIAIIGGTGLEDPEILKGPESHVVETPYGNPSSEIKTGRINHVDVAILSRHGKDHSLPPSQINYRANMYALQKIGCTHIVATTACGSLREQIGRGDLVLPDQFIDFTRHRHVTFFEEFKEGELKHTVMADPFDQNMRTALISSAKEQQLSFHEKGTVVTIEGPRFSTRAESNMFRIMGADVINMTTAQEAILSNELEIPYATIAMSTDYDCWKTDEEPVSWEEIVKVFNRNVDNVIQLILKALPYF